MYTSSTICVHGTAPSTVYITLAISTLHNDTTYVEIHKPHSETISAGDADICAHLYSTGTSGPEPAELADEGVVVHRQHVRTKIGVVLRSVVRQSIVSGSPLFEEGGDCLRFVADYGLVVYGARSGACCQQRQEVCEQHCLAIDKLACYLSGIEKVLFEPQV